MYKAAKPNEYVEHVVSLNNLSLFIIIFIVIKYTNYTNLLTNKASLLILPLRPIKLLHTL